MLRATYAALCLLVGTGCLPSTELAQPGPVTPPSTCGNHRCEPSTAEDCVNCPEDCPCCSATFAASTAVLDPESALGPADGVMAEIGEDTQIELTVGRQMMDQLTAGSSTGGSDFELVGQVDTSSTEFSAQCPVFGVEDFVGAVRVLVFDRGAWKQVGLWTSKSSAFNLACASVTETNRVRLEAPPGSRARLDALRATSCLE